MRASLALLCTIVFLASAPHSVRAGNARERQFIWNEANAMVLSARTADDFSQAAAAYRKLVDSGVVNGPLFHNLGTSLLQAGQHEQALSVFLRAERYSGSTWDTRRNIVLAMAGDADEKTYALPWHRYPLFWHYGMPCSVRISVAVLAFASFWIALSMLILGLRRPANMLMILSVALCLIFAYSATTSYHNEANALPILIEGGQPGAP